RDIRDANCLGVAMSRRQDKPQCRQRYVSRTCDIVDFPRPRGKMLWTLSIGEDHTVTVQGDKTDFQLQQIAQLLSSRPGNFDITEDKSGQKACLPAIGSQRVCAAKAKQIAALA